MKIPSSADKFQKQIEQAQLILQQLAEKNPEEPLLANLEEVIASMAEQGNVFLDELKNLQMLHGVVRSLRRQNQQLKDQLEVGEKQKIEEPEPKQPKQQMQENPQPIVAVQDAKIPSLDVFQAQEPQETALPAEDFFAQNSGGADNSLLLPLPDDVGSRLQAEFNRHIQGTQTTAKKAEEQKKTPAKTPTKIFAPHKKPATKVLPPLKPPTTKGLPPLKPPTAKMPPPPKKPLDPPPKKKPISPDDPLGMLFSLEDDSVSIKKDSVKHLKEKHERKQEQDHEQKHEQKQEQNRNLTEENKDQGEPLSEKIAAELQQKLVASLRASAQNQKAEDDRKKKDEKLFSDEETRRELQIEQHELEELVISRQLSPVYYGDDRFFRVGEVIVYRELQMQSDTKVIIATEEQGMKVLSGLKMRLESEQEKVSQPIAEEPPADKEPISPGLDGHKQKAVFVDEDGEKLYTEEQTMIELQIERPEELDNLIKSLRLNAIWKGEKRFFNSKEVANLKEHYMDSATFIIPQKKKVLNLKERIFGKKGSPHDRQLDGHKKYRVDDEVGELYSEDQVITELQIEQKDEVDNLVKSQRLREIWQDGKRFFPVVDVEALKEHYMDSATYVLPNKRKKGIKTRLFKKH